MLGIHYSFHDDGQNGFYCQANASANPLDTLQKIEQFLSENRLYTTIPDLLVKYPNPFKVVNFKNDLIDYTIKILEEANKITSISRRILVKHNKKHAAELLSIIGWNGDEKEADSFLEKFKHFINHLIDTKIIPRRLIVYTCEEGIVDLVQTIHKFKTDDDWGLNKIIGQKLKEAIANNDVVLTQCYELLYHFQPSCFDLAIKKQSEAIVELFLKKGCRSIYRAAGFIDGKYSEIVYQREVNFFKCESLDLALKIGNEQIIDQLVRAGFSIEILKEGCNALARAVKDGLDVKIIGKLLGLGAKIEVGQVSSFALSILTYNWPVMRLLAPKANLKMQHKLKLDIPGGCRAEGTSIASLIVENAPVLMALKELKVNFNFYDYSGFTPLYFAISRSRTESARELLESGADPNFYSGGIFPFRNWWNRSHRETALLLLRYGYRFDEDCASQILHVVYKSSFPETENLIKHLTEKVCVLKEEEWKSISEEEKNRLRPMMMHKIL